MKRPPRRRNTPLVDGGLLARSFLFLGLIEAALCYAGFFIVYTLLSSPDYLGLPVFPWLAHAGIIPHYVNLPQGQLYILAITVFHAGVVLAQVGNAFACRSEKEKGHRLGWLSNPLLLLGIAAEILIILSLVYFPPLAILFQHVPLPPVFWVGLLLFALIIYSLDRVRKEVVWRLERAREARQGETRT
jgi:magnesium-transporting ATPase (P-type)